MRFGRLLLWVTGAAFAQPAAAGSVYTFAASGKVTQVFGGPGSFTSDGRLKVGDPFSVKFLIDESSVVSTVTTVGSDRQAIYTFPITYSYTWGNYRAGGSLGLGGTVIINKNHEIGAGLIEDSIAFVGFLPATTNSPFNLSTPTVYSSFQVDAYDVGHNTLSGTGLNQIAKFALFPTQFAELAFTNSTFDTSVIAQANVTSATYSQTAAATPEPSGWAMMVLGFGIVGSAMRRPKKVWVAAQCA